jgi:hypothetical protein
MGWSRRQVVRAGLAGLALLWGGAAFLRPQESRVLGIIARHFGAAHAGSPESEAFVQDFVAAWTERKPLWFRATERLMPPGVGTSAEFETLVIETYVRATNVVLVEERGSAAFACSTMAPKASGSCTARSASTLRSTSITGQASGR